MRKLFLYCLMSVGVMVFCQKIIAAEELIGKDGKAETDAGKAPLKVLFLGNSQLRTHTVPLIIEQLSDSGPADYPRIVAG